MKKRKPVASAAKPQKKKSPADQDEQIVGDEITQSSAFRRATADAEAYVGDPKRLGSLVADAVGKINIIPRGPFGETWPYLLAMVRVIRDFQRGEYRDMAAPKLLIIIAAI